MITGEQIRAARALLRIEQKELSKLSGVSLPTVQRLELQRGTLRGSYRTIEAIRGALERLGIVFTKHGVEHIAGEEGKGTAR